MKISYNWLKEYIDIDLPVEEVAALLTDIGLEVEGLEMYETVKGGLHGLVTGKVESCDKHPDADKLSVTMVDTGQGDLLQIVCGAPNVAAGQKVVVAVVGTTIYPTVGEPFKIGKAKIRGVESSGMICAEDEIGLGDSHAGIMVLPENTAIGLPAATVLGVMNDTVFEIGLTPNRSDAFSHIGVARDLRAALSMRQSKDLALRYPDITAFKEGSGAPVDIDIQDIAACPRYAGLTITGIQVQTSPAWLQDRLKAIGLRPINNIVDITNYIQYEYGQPLHAFDLAAVKGNKIVVRSLQDGAPFVSLDGEKRSLAATDLMICNDSEAMCIAGVYGGLHSGVTEATTAIFLESAFFNPKSIRATSVRHGLRTDAAQHFEKGIDPDMTVEALKRAALLISQLAGGKISSPLYDIYPQPIVHRSVFLSTEKVRELTGAPISDDRVLKALELLEIEVVNSNGHLLELAVPPYRSDVTRDVDVVEDILRIYGYNQVPLSSRISFSLPEKTNSIAAPLRESTATILSANGAYEMMTNPLTRSKYFEGMDWIEQDKTVRLLSSINTELDVLRPHMFWTGLESVALNLNHKNTGIVLYEFGKTYTPEAEGCSEEEILVLYAAGTRTNPNWHSPQRKGDFYYLKSLVEMLFEKWGISGWKAEEVNTPWLGYGIEYSLNKQILARVGCLSPAITKRFEIKQEVCYAECYWQQIVRSVTQRKGGYREINRFPTVRRDLALLLDKKIAFSTLETLAKKAGGQILQQVGLFDVYEGEKIAEGKKSYAISLSFKHRDRTLTDEEVDVVVQKLVTIFQQEMGATLR